MPTRPFVARGIDQRSFGKLPFAAPSINLHNADQADIRSGCANVHSQTKSDTTFHMLGDKRAFGAGCEIITPSFKRFERQTPMC